MLGEVHLKLNEGVCPPEYQNSFGKVLEACFAVPPFHPYIITTDPLGGSDLAVLKIFADKFHFSPEVKPMDMTLGNGQPHIEIVRNTQHHDTF